MIFTPIQSFGLCISSFSVCIGACTYDGKFLPPIEFNKGRAMPTFMSYVYVIPVSKQRQIIVADDKNIKSNRLTIWIQWQSIKEKAIIFLSARILVDIFWWVDGNWLMVIDSSRITISSTKGAFI